MGLVAEYRDARRIEDVARIRRVLSLRAMVATGMSQRQIAASIGITQPAVSQQLTFTSELANLHPELLVDAAAPILKALAEERGYTRLAVFGSVGRRQARADSDIDLLIEPPPSTSSFEFVGFRQLIEKVLGRDVDLVSYGSLTPKFDDDIRREAVLL